MDLVYFNLTFRVYLGKITSNKRKRERIKDRGGGGCLLRLSLTVVDTPAFVRFSTIDINRFGECAITIRLIDTFSLREWRCQNGNGSNGSCVQHGGHVHLQLFEGFVLGVHG